MIDEKKSKSKGVIYRDDEIVDIINGEVEEDRLFVSKPSIRASDYAEWEQKKHHEPLFSDADKRLWVPIWRVGEEIGAPKWLRQEVFWFYKKARVLRTRPEFKGKGIYVSDKKYILAVYYVVAKKRGLIALAEQIASMPCNPQGEPCYVNRKRGDPKFKKYLKIALRYASRIYPNHVRDPVTAIEQLSNALALPEIIFQRAREIAIKIKSKIAGRQTNTVVAACLKITLDEIFPESSKVYFKIICRQLKTIDITVMNLVRMIKQELGNDKKTN